LPGGLFFSLIKKVYFYKVVIYLSFEENMSSEDSFNLFLQAFGFNAVAMNMPCAKSILPLPPFLDSIIS
jgi:hypothetical protein